MSTTDSHVKRRSRSSRMERLMDGSSTEPHNDLSPARYIYQDICQAIGAAHCFERYAKKAADKAEDIKILLKILYRTDKDSNRYGTYQDKVVEVLTEEQHKSRLIYKYIKSCMD